MSTGFATSISGTSAWRRGAVMNPRGGRWNRGACGCRIARLRSDGVCHQSIRVSRYRGRHRASRTKSDARDAIVLANVLRTEAHAHRPLPADSEAVRAPRALTRAQQDAVWDRVGLTNRL